MKKLIAAFAAALLITACGDSGNTLTEQVLENQPGVSDVQIGDDGTPATIEIQNDGTTAVISGNGTDVPADFPIPFPDGGEVQSVIQTNGGPGEASASVVVTFPATRWDEIRAFYESWADTLPDDHFTNVVSGQSPGMQVLSEEAGVSLVAGVEDDVVTVVASTIGR